MGDENGEQQTIVVHDAEAGCVDVDGGAAEGVQGVGPPLPCGQAEPEVVQEVACRDLGQQDGGGRVSVQLVWPQFPLPQHIKRQRNLQGTKQQTAVSPGAASKAARGIESTLNPLCSSLLMSWTRLV